MIRNYPVLIAFLLLTTSCANRSVGPQGGPKDITPPAFVKSTPSNGQLQVNDKDIELEFNEFVNLDKPGEKIIISPPQVLPPTIRTVNKRVLVTLNDSLQANTTYSIDFTSAIVDINERNSLNGFTYCFSTGDKIDSLQIAGLVLDAENLNPLPNLLVGIYDNLNDTAFIKSKPLRIARTNEEGWFSIKNVKESKYHIFALNDLNRDFIYNDPNEQMAFCDSIILPSSKIIVVEEDSASVDSVPAKRAVNKTVFLPDSLLLLAFKEKVIKQSFIKAERKDPYKLTFYFNAPNSNVPVITPLNFSKSKQDFLQTSSKADTIYYWIADSAIWQQDTLKLSVAYEKADSTGSMMVEKDSVALTYKKPVVPKQKGKGPAAPINLLPLKSNISRDIEIYDQPLFTFDLPILSADGEKIHLYYKKDTLWEELPVVLEKKDTLGFKYGFATTWNTDLSYKIDVDSAAFVSKYGTHTLATSFPFKVKGLDQYATLIVILANNPEQAVVELLNSKDAVIKRLPIINGEVIFEYLKPGDYYFRLFIDTNNNGMWDPGKYSDKKQAEKVYYFNTLLNLRANWDVEQEWNIKAITLSEQKPKELLPKTKR